MDKIKIGFAGTDARTLLSAHVVSTAKGESQQQEYEGVVIRGTPGMKAYAEMQGWPIGFIPTANPSVGEYALACIRALETGELDYVVPMPEALLFEGFVDILMRAGMGRKVAGLTQKGAFIEADKIECKRLCRHFNIPTADWHEVDARDYQSVLATCLEFFDAGGAVLKYPYSAAGKGARVIISPWDIKHVWEELMRDYSKSYAQLCEERPWPLLIESRLAGFEISFTVFIDSKGNFQIMPTALDYPERFPGPAGKNNPVTGGMNSISPHPMETPELIEMVGDQVIRPLVRAMKVRGILRPCIVYPGCFVTFNANKKPKYLYVSEINIRPGEPEWQVVARRLRNLGELCQAMFAGNLDEIKPQVRENQIAMTCALVTGPGGPDGQKGYPWSCTKGERMEIDTKYLRKNGIFLVPSGMDVNEAGEFLSDGTRIAYLAGNAALNGERSREDVATQLREKLLRAHSEGKVRVIPREDPRGNRLAVREDIGIHFQVADRMFSF